MNYYQKYQKYKFKYYNLLNQSGGYTDDEFNELIKKKDKKNKNEVIEGSKCPISQAPVLKEKAILIDTQIYDACELFEYILHYYDNKSVLPVIPLNPILPPIPVIPHNRNQFTIVMLFAIYNKVNSLYDNKDRIHFKKLILRQILIHEKSKELSLLYKQIITEDIIMEAMKYANQYIIDNKNIFYKKSADYISKGLVADYKNLAFIDDEITEQMVDNLLKSNLTLNMGIYRHFIPKKYL